jgi:hypothetical protein
MRQITLPSPYREISNEVVHPSIIKLTPDISEYQYALAYTPYPNTDSHYENPCVAFTNDFVRFVGDVGNPIVKQPAHGYNSDPELCIVDKRLYLINRFRSTLGNICNLYEFQAGEAWVFKSLLIEGEYQIQDFGSPSLVFYENHCYFFSHNLDAEDWGLELRISNRLEEIQWAQVISLRYDAQYGKIWHSSFRQYKDDLIGLVQFANHTGGVGKLAMVKVDLIAHRLIILDISELNFFYKSGLVFDAQVESAELILSTNIGQWELFHVQKKVSPDFLGIMRSLS